MLMLGIICQFRPSGQPRQVLRYPHLAAAYALNPDHQLESIEEVVASAFGCIVADELNKVKQTSLNGQGPHVDGPNDEASGEGDMLWQYDTMALPLPAELADEDYEELMLVMEHALYDDLQAELQIQESLNKTLHKVEL
ncbi:unnamed protein product [Sphagnum jensenii]